MTVAEFKEKLKGFELTVVTSPLNESEVTFIESILSRKLPNYYREFLLTIGLKQDAIWGVNDRISDSIPWLIFYQMDNQNIFFSLETME